MANFSMVEVLENESVRCYFISILSSSLSSGKKYDRIVQFFKRKENGIPESMETQPLKLEAILEKTNNSISKYVLYLKKCQKSGGGWGFQPQGDFWETAHALLFLQEIKMGQDQTSDIPSIPMADGIKRIENYFKEQWASAVDRDGQIRRPISTYDISLFIALVYKIGLQDRFDI